MTLVINQAHLPRYLQLPSKPSKQSGQISLQVMIFQHPLLSHVLSEYIFLTLLFCSVHQLTGGSRNVEYDLPCIMGHLQFISHYLKNNYGPRSSQTESCNFLRLVFSSLGNRQQKSVSLHESWKVNSCLALCRSTYQRYTYSNTGTVTDLSVFP